jgi:hypothetical protein
MKISSKTLHIVSQICFMGDSLVIWLHCILHLGHTIIYIPEDTTYVVLFREMVLITLNICLSSLTHPVLCLRQTVRDIWGYLTKKLQLWLHIKEPAWTYIFIGCLRSTFLLEISSDRKGSHLSLVHCLAHIVCNIVRLVSWVCLWHR